MANDGRSSRKAKEDESINSKEKFINGKGSPPSVSGGADTSGLRRSSREKSSGKQMIQSPSKIRKSERLEKRTTATLLGMKKSVRSEKQLMGTPLRISDRGKKKYSSSSSLGSKKSREDSAPLDMKGKRETSETRLKQSTEDTSEVIKNENKDLDLVGKKRKGTNARSSKALFKSQRRRTTNADNDKGLRRSDNSPQVDSGSNGDVDENVERPDQVPQVDSRGGGGSGSKSLEDKGDGDDERGETVGKILAEECIERVFESPNGVSDVEGTVVDTAILLVSPVKTDLSPPELVGLTSGRALDGGESESGYKTVSNRNIVNMNTDVYAIIDCKDTPTSKADAISSPLSEGRTHDSNETCTGCFKSWRLDNDFKKREGLCSCDTTLNKKLCGTSIPKTEKEPIVKLSGLPAECPPGIGNNHLRYVNKLRDYWSKGQCAVVFDDQARISKVILFIVSLKNVSQPFLIITTSTTLSLWENEFSRLASSIHVLVYNGTKENRESIRILKFYGGGGQIVFRVLLSSVGAISEDSQMLERIRWEVVIVDECQRPHICKHFQQIKTLATETRMLLFSSPMKENVAEYHHVLALLGSDGNMAGSTKSKTVSDDNLGRLKESLSPFIAYDCISESSRFLEYWVPVNISNLQLEQYCATLLSNSIALCSCSKIDPAGVLRDTILSSRKCCDHPYIIDPSLQGSITKDIPVAEYLDVGIKASGKLQLLDGILSEMKKRQLRVLILFQPITGSEREAISIGDILDDFVRQRFGQDSYERVDGGTYVDTSKRQAALNNFNNDKGRFVFLLEHRACVPSIKLSSVDAIVIFDSDLNPMNDRRALHKIRTDSQSEQITIFRLYACCTVEEKILLLADRDLTPEKFQNLNRSTSDTVLMWGASYLFCKLDEFHSASKTNISSEQSELNNLVEDILDLVDQNCKTKETTNSIITRVEFNRGTYSKNIPLLGKQKVQLQDGEQTYMFWRKLLEGKRPQWKYLSPSTPRQRKRVHYSEGPTRRTDVAKVEVAKKQKKLVASCTDLAPLTPVLEAGASGVTSSFGSPGSFRSTEVQKEMTLADNSLHDLLKLDVSRLCKILKLSEEINDMIANFLKYIIENHRVSREPETIVQAFLISLCWIGASLLKNKIDKKESIALAKKHMNFTCTEEEAISVYSKLKLLTDSFLSNTKNIVEPDSSNESRRASEATAKESLDLRVSHNLQVVKVECEERPHSEYVSDEVIVVQEQSPLHGTPTKETQKSMKQADKECEKQMIAVGEVLELLERLHLPLSTNPQLSHSLHNLPLDSGIVDEPPFSGQSIPVNAGAPPRFAVDLADVTDNAISQTVENLEMHPLVDAELPSGRNQPEWSAVGRLDHNPFGELHSSSQNAEVLPQVVETTVQMPRLPGLCTAPSLSIAQGSDNPNQVGSWMSTPLVHAADPLQIELNRLCKEMEHVITFHEDTKLRLKSECDKEIAEVIAQIKSKYEFKLQDAEAAFLLKRKELDTNHNTVLMNKVLADAFRSKFLDIWTSGAMGMQQVVPSSFMQQLFQLSWPSPVVASSSAGQPSLSRRITTAPRSSPVVASSSAGQPSLSQHTTTEPRPFPVVASSSSGQPSFSLHTTTAPPHQFVNNSAAPFSSSPTRQPNINPITLSAGNIRVGGEIRAPAPHIQPFKPSTSISPGGLASFQLMIPSQHVQSSLHAASTLRTQASSRPPSSSPPADNSSPLSPPFSTIHSGLLSSHAPSTLPAPPPFPQDSAQLPSSSAPANLSSLPSQHRSSSLPGNSPSLSQASYRPTPPSPLPNLLTNRSGLQSRDTPSALPVTSPSLPQSSSHPAPLSTEHSSLPKYHAPISLPASFPSLQQASSQQPSSVGIPQPSLLPVLTPVGAPQASLPAVLTPAGAPQPSMAPVLTSGALEPRVLPVLTPAGAPQPSVPPILPDVSCWPSQQTAGSMPAEISLPQS